MDKSQWFCLGLALGAWLVLITIGFIGPKIEKFLDKFIK